jgi:hypothetical protein
MQTSCASAPVAAKADIEQTMVYLFYSHYQMMLALEWHNSVQASSQHTAEFGKMKGGNANGLWGVAELSGAKLGMSHVASAFKSAIHGHSIM